MSLVVFELLENTVIRDDVSNSLVFHVSVVNSGQDIADSGGAPHFGFKLYLSPASDLTGREQQSARENGSHINKGRSSSFFFRLLKRLAK